MNTVRPTSRTYLDPGHHSIELSHAPLANTSDIVWNRCANVGVDWRSTDETTDEHLFVAATARHGTLRATSSALTKSAVFAR
jgi:hypothetical protein